jgi:ribonuclease R
MDETELIRRILECVHHPDYRPIKPKAIGQRLDLDPELFDDVRRQIKRLVKRGDLVYLGQHRVAASATAATSRPAASGAGTGRHPGGRHQTGSEDAAPKNRAGRESDSKLRQGTIRLAAGGFGFLRPAADQDGVGQDDIFIPAPAIGSAMDGDTVLVRLRRGRAGKQEGEVEEIVQRARRSFAGTFHRIAGEPRVWLDGVLQQQPIEVGDIRGLPLEEGDKVVVELVRYPDMFHHGEGVILEVLGSSHNPAVDTLAIIHQFGLADAFPEAVIEEARQQADAALHSDEAGRRDVTEQATVTIDPVDARDFDDAISLCRNSVGNWELQVHIADVAHFVPAGSELDREAVRRGTSVYLPDRVLPMLPEIISNSLASLQPERVRLAKSVLIEFSPEGTPLHWEVFNSRIRNHRRFTYEEVDAYLANPESWRDRLTPDIHQLLRDMHTLAMTLRQRRMADGAIELSLPEVKVELDRSGKVKGAKAVQQTESHQIIEEFMLAANETVAAWLDDLEIPFLRRAHAPPRRAKLKQLTNFVRELGIDCQWLESRFEIQRVLSQVRDTPLEYAVNYAVLKSLSKAVYQPQAEGHYALNKVHYCHFTSPIRRYPRSDRPPADRPTPGRPLAQSRPPRVGTLGLPLQRYRTERRSGRAGIGSRQTPFFSLQTHRRGTPSHHHQHLPRGPAVAGNRAACRGLRSGRHTPTRSLSLR